MKIDRLNRLQQKAFKKLHRMGVVKPVVVKQMLHTDYDVATGDVKTKYKTENCLAHVVGFSTRELTNQVLATDLKCSIPRLDLTFTPRIDDVVIYEGVEFSVVNDLSIPSETMLVLQLRGL